MPEAPELRRQRFEDAWRAWQPGQQPPRWQEFLPAASEACRPEVISLLLHLDIEFRARAGLPALLSERYFEHPRLQEEDARLDAEQQVELIRWEYQQLWKNGRQARRADYEAAFSQHAAALRDLKPRSRCLQCQKMVVLEETYQTLICPHCGGTPATPVSVPPFVAESTPPTTAPAVFDPRSYELSEQLGKGGMGEVYRCCDPALGRDLAIKIMKANLGGHPEIERRFLREARITGSLQHPGIVPVHNLGRLADGRLHYTMRLVRGQTLADILKEEAGKPERLPYLLSIFEKICQAVAYAHSKRVIHRDLKPSNVMVGRFGEVQVMDWGLAKVLTLDDTAGESGERTEAAGTHIPTEGDTPLDLSRMGSGFGTPAYMPPEQALGEWDSVDERADVFALGSILCEMLTGQPAYSGPDGQEVYRRARRGDVTKALERLEQCDADAALTALCRESLALERDQRPRNASVLAERVAVYQAEVQERLRQAELERVAAQTRAEEEQARARVEQERTREALARVAAEMERTREAQARARAERRARRRTLALAAAVLVLVVSGGGAYWWKHLKQDQADREALLGLERGRERLEEGWRRHDLRKLGEARTEADRAADIARGGGAREAVEQQIAALQAETQQRLDRARKNETLLRDLLDIALPHETRLYVATESGQVMAMAEPSVEEQFAAAFGRRGLAIDVDPQAAAEVAARLQEEPEVVVQGVIAGLDAWITERRGQQGPEAEWRRLLEVVERLDPSAPRKQLRALLIGATPPPAASVMGLLGGRPPWLGLWEMARGGAWRHLQQLRGQMKVADQPVLTVLLLAQASSAVGDLAGAEEVLQLALARRPQEVVLLVTLGNILERQGRLAEAIGCYRAARARDSGLGVALCRALTQNGQARAAEAIIRDLILNKPHNPELFFSLGNALYAQGKAVEAEEACRKAIEFKPDLAEAHYNLGIVLEAQGKAVEAEEACRKAIALKPDFARAYVNFGVVLKAQGRTVEAEAAYRKAIALRPDLAEAYNNLGTVLEAQGKAAEAEAACRKALEFKPDDAKAYVTLGVVLKAQGRTVEAEAAYRKAIALRPDLAEAYNNLVVVLFVQGKTVEAEAACRKAIALRPDLAKAYLNLGNLLGAQGKAVEAEAAYRKAIALKPDYAEAYVNLGVVLLAQGKAAEAETACRKAIALKPDLAGAYVKLGNTLQGQRKAAEAEAAYRKAIALKPNRPDAYVNLGVILNIQGKPVEAEAICRKAIELKADYAEAYVNLGIAMQAQGKAVEAEAVYRKAIELKVDYAEAHYNLGAVLNAQGKAGEAEDPSRKAIALKPDFAEAHCNLGAVLQNQGRFTESLAAWKRGHELGLKQPGWRHPTEQRVRNAQSLVELAKKLPTVLQGEASPADSVEAAILASMCQQPYKRLYAASARLSADAFATEPKLAADLNQQLRYNAACSAALAAAGQGKDARMLPDKTVAMFRRWALGWLRDDLTAYASLAERKNPAVNRWIQQRLHHWHSDPALASVRDRSALDRLPAHERAAWQSLWREVDELAKRVAGQDRAEGRKSADDTKNERRKR